MFFLDKSLFVATMDVLHACRVWQARAALEREQGNYSRPIATECKKAQVYWPAEVSARFTHSTVVHREYCLISCDDGRWCGVDSERELGKDNGDVSGEGGGIIDQTDNAAEASKVAEKTQMLQQNNTSDLTIVYGNLQLLGWWSMFKPYKFATAVCSSN